MTILHTRNTKRLTNVIVVQKSFSFCLC